MKAVIMAGGKGSRLRPLTSQLPKPMVPLLDRPCMEYIIELLKRHGVTEIAVTVQYLSNVIKKYFGDGREYGVRLHYFEEVEPLGTAGSVKNAEEFLDETFLVISGDALTDFDLKRAVDFHREKQTLGTLVLTRVEVPLEYGVVMTREDGRIARFLEKPSWGEVFSDTVNTGIYVLEPEILTLFRRDQVFDFGKDLFPLMMERGLPLYGYVADGYWSDIGNLTQYRQAQFDILNGNVDVRIVGQEVSPGVWVGEHVELASSIHLEAPAFIGTGSTLASECHVGPQSILGRYNQVERQAVVARSVLWNRNYVGPAASINGATLCHGIHVGTGVDICEDAVIGDKTRIGNLTVIRPGVKVWPEKIIAEGTIQQSSLIWGNSMFASLFGEDGISGIPNLELIPEMVSRIASAYGSTLKPGSVVSVSCDENPYSGILKYAVISSLMAIGVKVRDIGAAPVPVARYESRRSNCDGGIHIRSMGIGDDKRMVVQFFDREGLPIDKATERKVENAFFQEDFARPGVRGLGGIEQATQIARFYMEEVLSRVHAEHIQERSFRVVLHCDSSQIMSVMLPILEHLNCQVVTLSRGDRDIGKAVTNNAADIGVGLSAGGQDFRLFTEKGHELSNDELLILQMLMAVKERIPVAVPVTAPSVVEEMSETVGIPVVRTKTVLRSLLEVGVQSPLQVPYDGFYAVVALMQFLFEEGLTLQDVVNQLPMFHMQTEVVSCPIEAKGRVMRRLMEEMKGDQLQLIDGIKVLTDEGWALILPDSERAQFKIVAQGNTQSKAHELTDVYKSKIMAFQRNEVG